MSRTSSKRRQRIKFFFCSRCGLKIKPDADWLDAGGGRRFCNQCGRKIKTPSGHIR